jgi:hypothetical protein
MELKYFRLPAAQPRNLLLRRLQLRLQLGIGRFHRLGGEHQALDDRPHAGAVAGPAQPLRAVREIGRIIRGGAFRRRDHRHDLVDLVGDLRP